MCVSCEDDGRSLAHSESLVTTYELGVSACPLDLGEIEVELVGPGVEGVTLSVTDDMPEIAVLDPDAGWPINDGYTTTLYPGEPLVFRVQFDCGAVEDVTGSIVLEARDGEDGLPGDTVALELKTPWKDGTSWISMSADTFLERLCSLVPRTGTHQVLYRGVLAAHSERRARVVPSARRRQHAP